MKAPFHCRRLVLVYHHSHGAGLCGGRVVRARSEPEAQRPVVHQWRIVILRVGVLPAELRVLPLSVAVGKMDGTHAKRDCIHGVHRRDHVARMVRAEWIEARKCRGLA